MSDSILQAGLQGIQGGMDQFGRAASQVASAANANSANTTSLANSVVELKQAQTTVEASAKVVAAADSLVGSLLDELA
jgi:hypothetical protein